jgi:hypothetical protein
MGTNASPIYTIQGHGSEWIRLKRFWDIPEKVTIVFLTKASIPLLAPELCKFNDFFRDINNKYLLENPLKYREELRKTFPNIRIYSYGQKIPRLSTSLEVSHINIDNSNNNAYGKAGIFKFPNLPKIDKSKLLISQDMTISNIIRLLKSNIKINESTSIYIIISGKNIMLSGSQSIFSIYQEHKNDDGFLYLEYCTENVFG